MGPISPSKSIDGSRLLQSDMDVRIGARFSTPLASFWRISVAIGGLFWDLPDVSPVLVILSVERSGVEKGSLTCSGF